MNIAVIGSGYVGLVTGACFSALGHKVICIDRDQKKIETINRGQAPFFEPGLDEILQKSIDSGKLYATCTVEEAIKTADITFIAVGTPTVDGKIDLSQVLGATHEIGRVLGKRASEHTVVVKSTVLPGTTDGPVHRTLAGSANIPVNLVNVAANPEFLRQGAAVEDFMNPDRIVVGAKNSKITARVMSLYSKIDAPKIVTTAASAELIKYATNALLATSISFSNEIANICECTEDADINSVMEGLHADKRLSSSRNGRIERAGIVTYLRAGCGFGGSCLPKDVRALAQYAQNNDVSNKILRAAIETNETRVHWLVDRAKARLGALSDRTILVIGLAFKVGTDDIRDSPALSVLDDLSASDAKIIVWDPYVSDNQLPPTKNLLKIDDVIKGIRCCDAILITSAFHELGTFDWHTILKGTHCTTIIDGRGVLADADLPDSICYDTVGRKPS